MPGAGGSVLSAQGGSELRDAGSGAPRPSGRSLPLRGSPRSRAAPGGAPRGAGAGPAPARPRSAPPRPGTARPGTERHGPLRSDQVSSRHGTAWHGSVPARYRPAQHGQGGGARFWYGTAAGKAGGDSRSRAGDYRGEARGVAGGLSRVPAGLAGVPSAALVSWRGSPFGSPFGSPSPGRDVAGGCPQDSSPRRRVGGLGVASPPGSTQRVAVGRCPPLAQHFQPFPWCSRRCDADSASTRPGPVWH